MNTLDILQSDYPIFLYSITFLFGLCLGSFASALCYRVPRGLPWSYDRDKASGRYIAIRSMCPSCEHVLNGRDLIPVLSWILSGRKCRYCHDPVSVRYPIYEIISGFMACFILMIATPYYDVVLAIIISMPFTIAAGVSIIGQKKWPWALFLIIFLVNVAVLILL